MIDELEPASASADRVRRIVDYRGLNKVTVRKPDDPPVPWTYQHPPTEPICDQATRLSLSKQVLFPNVDGEFRQRWLDEAGTIGSRRIYSRSDIHIIQTLVSGDFGVPLSEQFYAVLWPYIRARDLGELFR